jgi:hypothetical protein
MESENRASSDAKAAAETPERGTGAGLYSTNIPLHRSWRARILEWFGDIVIVFVGVYAAFLLNAWQTQRQDRSRHLQILRALDEQETETVESCKQALARTQQSVDKFQHAVEAGEMPALGLLEFSTDYDPADDVALAQAGADHLLSVKTMAALKKVTSVQRIGFMTLRDRQQQALELVGPRLDDPKESFYDPQTKKLKRMFSWYLKALQEIKEFMQETLSVNEALLKEVRAERAALR